MLRQTIFVLVPMVVRGLVKVVILLCGLFVVMGVVAVNDV